MAGSRSGINPDWSIFTYPTSTCGAAGEKPAGPHRNPPSEWACSRAVDRGDRGTLFLFVPVLLAAGAILYYTAPVEPAFYALWASTVTLAVMSRARRLVQLALL
ncbi:MAG: hypothetical protein ABWZ83_01315 [Mesorhizobium sp.]